jgi:hypothetical protein
MPPFLVVKKTKVTVPVAGAGVGKRRTYRASANPDKVEAAIAHFKTKIYTDANISRGPNGYYTWLLKDLTDGGSVLVAGNTRTNQELGTLHKNMDDFTGPGTVVAAGEFSKEGDDILFNLQSGTYMKRAIRTPEIRDEIAARAISEFVRKAGLRPAFKMGGGGDSELAGAPMIDIADIRTEAANIENYNRFLSASFSPSDSPIPSGSI